MIIKSYRAVWCGGRGSSESKRSLSKGVAMSVRNRTIRGALAGLAVLAALMLAVTALVWLPAGRAQAAALPTGLHVTGSQLVTSSGTPIVLRGVNRSGTEYQCIHNNGIFDGPNDAASVAAMASWHINTVRVPLNEDCWLGIDNAPSAYSGSAYQSAIKSYVSGLHAAGLVAILDLHWTAAGTNQAGGQQQMPDADHAPEFWASVATAFKNDTSTVFDLFNEPFGVSWSCWLNGGDCGVGYTVAGMQTLVNAVRATGSTNPVLLGGLAYANDLSSWLANRPTDPTGNLMASWHSYNFNACSTVACWNSQLAPVAASVPVVAGEIGENDCAHGYLDTLLPWLDRHGAGYLGWGWNTFDCASFPALISDYSGTPTSFGVGLKSHLAALATSPPTSPPTSVTPTKAPSTTATPTKTPTTKTPSPTPTGTGRTSLGAVSSTLTASAPWWWEEGLNLKPSATISSLTVIVTVARTTGISYSGLYTNGPGDVLAVTETTGTGGLVYRVTLNPGRTLPADTDLRVGAQYSGTGTAHPTSGDTYQITATVGATAVTAAGHF
ncbi:MAG: cellulose-binding protein [Pseudonocardiales bacterium]|nr:cellulose-binding protein [Pseudonocardiales bacterium]